MSRSREENILKIIHLSYVAKMATPYQRTYALEVMKLTQFMSEEVVYPSIYFLRVSSFQSRAYIEISSYIQTE